MAKLHFGTSLKAPTGLEEVKPAMAAHRARRFACGNFPSRKCLAPARLDSAGFQSALEEIMLDGTGPSQVTNETRERRCVAAGVRRFLGKSA
jgi:hypothetical protein